MKQIKINVNKICKNSIIIVYILLFSYLLLQHFIIKDSPYRDTVIFSFSLAINVLLITKLFREKWNKYSNDLNIRNVLIGLVLLCILVKGYFIFRYRITPLSDYKTFYDTAIQLKDGWRIDNDYISIFPHIMGYSTFLSFIFKLFGSNTLIPPIVNVIISTVIMILIFKICHKLISDIGAIIASLIFIFMPSQTIYNIFALSEPLYTLLVVLLVWLIVQLKDNMHLGIKNSQNILYLVFISGSLVFINYIRPIGAILIIALFIWLIFLCEKQDLDLKKRIIYLIVIVGIYIVGGKITDNINNSRLGNDVSTLPGHTICVGLNEQAYGAWNMEDSTALMDYFNEYEKDVKKTHQAMMERAVERIKNGIDYGRLFKWKLYNLWGADDACVGYATGIWNNEILLSKMCNIYYYTIVFISILGALKLVKEKRNSILVFLILITLGITAGHMIVEVARRYHYVALITLIILAAYGLTGVRENTEGE